MPIKHVVQGVKGVYEESWHDPSTLGGKDHPSIWGL